MNRRKNKLKQDWSLEERAMLAGAVDSLDAIREGIANFEETAESIESQGFDPADNQVPLPVPISTLEAVDDQGNPLTGQGVTVGIVSDSFAGISGGLDSDIASGDIPADVNIISDTGGATDEGRAIAQIVTDIAPDADIEFASVLAGRRQAQIESNAIPQEQIELLEAFGLPSNFGGNLLQQDLPPGVFEQAEASSDQLNTSDVRLNGIESLSLGLTLADDLPTANAYRQLIENGTSDIIVDDSAFPFGPVFQRSLTARAQQDAIDAGISVFESAGNNGRDAVEVEFTGEVGDFVDFDPNTDGIQGIPVTYSRGENVTASLHWDDPFPSILPPLNESGLNAEPGAASAVPERAEVTADFEFLFVSNDSALQRGAAEPDPVFLTSGTRPIFGADRIQLEQEEGGDSVRSTGIDPVEGVSLNVNAPETDAAGTVSGQWVARLVEGDGGTADAPRRLRATFVNGGNLNQLPQTFPRASTSNSTQAPLTADVEAGSDPNGRVNVIGAVDALNNGLQQTSAAGPNQILFDDAGNRIPESERPAPVNVSFLAPDNFNNTFFGTDSFADGDTFPNFTGTSAATPAAAGVAALLLEADPDLTPSEVTDSLVASADFRGETVNDEANFDRTGFGLINAQSAVNNLPPQTTDGPAPVAPDAGTPVAATPDEGTPIAVAPETTEPAVAPGAEVAATEDTANEVAGETLVTTTQPIAAENTPADPDANQSEPNDGRGSRDERSSERDDRRRDRGNSGSAGQDVGPEGTTDPETSSAVIA